MRILEIKTGTPDYRDDVVTVEMTRGDLNMSLTALEGYATKTRGLDFDQVKSAVFTAQRIKRAMKDARSGGHNASP